MSENYGGGYVPALSSLHLRVCNTSLWHPVTSVAGSQMFTQRETSHEMNGCFQGGHCSFHLSDSQKHTLAFKPFFPWNKRWKHLSFSHKLSIFLDLLVHQSYTEWLLYVMYAFTTYPKEAQNPYFPNQKLGSVIWNGWYCYMLLQ